MTSRWSASRLAIGGLVLAGLGAAMAPAPVLAQDDEARLRRLESELRALQRAVFPGGDGRYFAPEVDTSPGQTPAPAGIAPSTSALTDVFARLDAMEAQLARLTARSEENANELAQFQLRLEEAQAAAAPAVVPPTGVITPPANAAATPAPAPAASVSPARLAAVQAIAKPATEDAGDDEYTYGFRLWEAGYYPEARQQLSLFTQRYPNHARISFGRNLLGRAFLDDGQPREAATHFFDNYQKDKEGPRAADSLLYLSEAMILLNDTNRACIALAEFGETYPALATGRLKEQYDRNRSRVRCT
jgi:TolA-binding protein